MQPSNWDDIPSLSDKPATSCLWASTGDAGSGKSWFLCSAPGPLWVAAFDPFGMNRVDKSIYAGKDVRISRYPFNPTKYKTKDDVKKAGAELWRKFLEDYSTAIKNVRTIGIDREDMMYKMQRYANWGDTSSAPKDYEDLYIEYVGLIQEASAAGVNLGLLRGLKSKWVSKFDSAKQKMVGHDTGELIADGMKTVPSHVDITLFHRWDETLKAYVTKIDKFTNPEYRGTEVENLTFSQMAFAAFPDSDEDSWV